MPTLQWIGKEKVVSHHHDVAFLTLEHQYGFRAEQPDDTSETFSGNKIIHGDNLEVLKALLPEWIASISILPTTQAMRSGYITTMSTTRRYVVGSIKWWMPRAKISRATTSGCV